MTDFEPIRKYTSEDREQFAKIKRMFDEAHWCYEAADIEGYANKLADIKIADCLLYHKNNADKLETAQEIASNARKKRDWAWLKNFEDSLIVSAQLIESMMRRSFRMQMTGMLDIINNGLTKKS